MSDERSFQYVRIMLSLFRAVVEFSIIFKANCLLHISFSLTCCVVVRKVVVPFVVSNMTFAILHSAM